MEIVGESANSLGFFVLNTFFGDAYKKGMNRERK